MKWVTEDELGRFDDLLEQAVRRRLAFGRVGVYLSGGLDSVTGGTRHRRAAGSDSRRPRDSLSCSSMKAPTRSSCNARSEPHCHYRIPSCH